MKRYVVLLVIAALIYPWLVQSVLIDRVLNLLTKEYGNRIESRIDETFASYNIIIK